ncbi:MAG: pentapeptide repeat-containing protein [Proteobacteria bacterium]|nr:pentapeptide repeat-containing protein [Pseudomonadota bacterium]
MELTPELEARFIEQEHRIVRVVQNYFDRKRWTLDDPRRAAARNAILWRMFAPGTAAVAASSLVAIATLVVLVWQTGLIAEQNEFFKEQNQKLQLQIDQQGDQDTTRRRTEIIAALYETQQGPHGGVEPKANVRTRGEAVAEFVQLERGRLKKLQARVPSYQGALSLTQARLDKLNLDNLDLQGIVLIGTFLENTSFNNTDLSGADLRAARMDGTSFLGAKLKGANLEGAIPLQVSFARADLRDAVLTSSSVRGCEFLGADLRRAEMTGIREWAGGASFKAANIAGVTGLSAEQRNDMLRGGAVEFPKDEDWARFQREVFSHQRR